MKSTKIIMGMPVTIEITDKHINKSSVKRAFDYFRYVDKKFSTYKQTSEITKIIQKKLKLDDYSEDMKLIFKLADETKQITNGYFDIRYGDTLDPSGIVKGWAINNVANILANEGYHNFYVDAGGDVQVSGMPDKDIAWKVGIRNPFKLDEIVKVVQLTNQGLATSGTYERGQHIYNPITGTHKIKDIMSITVIGPNIYEADRFATAAFAMGRDGINFIERLKGFEGYMIDSEKRGTATTGFNSYVLE